MKKCLVLLGVAALAVLLTTSALAGNRGVTFTPIGFSENPGANPASRVQSVNPQGTVFIVSPDAIGLTSVLWTREGGWGAQIGAAQGARISSDGTVMANGLYPASSPAYQWPGTWLGAKDMFDPIPANPEYAPCGNSRMAFSDQGGNGDYATGLTWAGCATGRAFKWDKATDTTIALGSPNGKSTRGNAITADGSSVFGWGTTLGGLRRGVAFEDGTVTFLGDPNGQEPKSCSNGKGCTSNTADPVTGCPDYVDDGSCPTASKGTCTGGVCVGGFDAGKTCTSNSQCGGTCAGGPNNGLRCTSNSSCPDTPVCNPNPLWTDDLFKGEALDCSADGRYVVGRNFDSSAKLYSGYRMNPDGSFTEMPPMESYPEAMYPLVVSDNGRVAGGYAAGSGPWGAPPVPFFWSEATGTVDLQLFLVSQGLDDLFFWSLSQVNSVSADGMVLGGFGINPDGLQEGFIVDLSKVWICHMPPGNPENARTLGIDFDSVGDHLAHGDFLGTCEFMNSGGLSRAADLRATLSPRATPTEAQRLQERYHVVPPSWNAATADWSVQSAKPTPVEARERANDPSKARRKKLFVE